MPYNDEGRREALSILKQQKGDTVNYLKFLLFPEFETPCRIPRLFPIPTHIWKDAGSVNITMTGGTGYVLFSPKLFSHGHGLGYIPGAITAG